MSRIRAIAVAAAFVAAATAGAVVGPGPASAAEPCAGVRVVVDAQAAGGAVTTRCVPGDPSSGFAVLEAAGHSYTFLPTQPGFVCTIDARPDPCNGAPPNAYWSYWHAQAGGDWVYSTRGAASRDPAPGEVEGWAFGAGAPPGIPPPVDPPPPPGPEPTSDPDPGIEPDPEPEPAREPEPVQEQQQPATDEGSDEGSDGDDDVTTSTTPSPDEPPAADEPDAPPATDEPDGPDTADGADESGAADVPRTPRDGTAADQVEAVDAAVDTTTEGRSGTAVLVGLGLLAAIGGGTIIQQRRRER